MSSRVVVHRDETDAGNGLPPAEAVDALAPEALVDFATRTAALHARAMARLTSLGTRVRCTEEVTADQYLDPAEIAARLKVPKPHVYAMIRSGELPGIAVGKYRRVRAEDFRAWAARNAIDPSTYVAYEADREGQRRPPAAETPRPDAAPVRRARGRGREQRRPLGTRRDADSRVRRTLDADARAGELDERP